MKFTYEEYDRLLKKINGLGSCLLFRELDDSSKHFLIRHDIDFSLKLAYEMAKIEYENNISATYFILTTCDSYNVISQESREYLRLIQELNHEIALHFDPTLYPNMDLDKVVKTEADILSFAAGCEIKSISLHNPSLHGQYPLFKDFVNAYDPKIFTEENYISDSCFSFRGKEPFEFIECINQGTVQVLIHPLHFTSHGGGYDEIFATHFAEVIYNHHNSYFKANKHYKEHVGQSFTNLGKIVKQKIDALS